MKELKVSIEINGNMVPVGSISGNHIEDAQFRYLESYRNREGIRPISVSLPLQEQAFSAKETRTFFEGLLPEGFSRKAVAKWTRTEENDYLTMLETLGQECLGALFIHDGSTDFPQADYKPLTMEEVKALAAEGATTSTRLLTETHLSLAGATGKAGLYYDETEDRWYLPMGSAPSTHIVKQSHVRYSQIVVNEQLCMRTAEILGINVPQSFVVNMGNGEDTEILFATKRYDRCFSDRILNGHKIPYRQHQEDFAEALGISGFHKYETTRCGYLGKMFRLISQVSSDPLEDKMELWNRVVFNYLIGNTDGHIKNQSLLYAQDFRSIRLAPAYDMVSTSIYSNFHDMSVFIGEHLGLEEITREDFLLAAEEAGIGKKIAMKQLDSMAERFERALHSAMQELTGLGYKNTEKLADQILKTGGIKYIK